MDKKFLDEVIRLSFAIERTVASDLDNPYCRSARVLAHELHELAAQHSVQRTACLGGNAHIVIKGSDVCMICGANLEASRR